MEGKALPSSLAPILITLSGSGASLLVSSCSLLQGKYWDFSEKMKCFWAGVKEQSMETAVKLFHRKAGGFFLFLCFI